jgi:multidrug efflux pump subunit AcrA (membrane-fusion protein)
LVPALLVILLGLVAILAKDSIWPAAGGAGTSGSHDEDEQHGVEWTVWQDGVELFVAHPHAIAGEPFDVVLHATEEQTGKPLSSGSVALTIAGNGKVFEGGPVEAGDSGVWAVAVELSTAGKYDMRLAIDSPQVPAGRLAFEGASLTVHESEKTLESIAIADDAADASEVHFLKEQQWRIGLRTAVVRPRSIAEQLVVPGKVVAPHGSETMVFSPVPGRVTPPPDGPLPQIGEAVEAGQTLAVIEPSIAGAQSVQLLVNQAQLRTLDAELAARQLDIESKLATARADLEFANQELQRLNGLSATGAVAGRKQAEADYRQKQAQAAFEGYERSSKTYEDARRRLTRFLGDFGAGRDGESEQDSLKVALRSPLAGHVVASGATAGEFVADDHLLFRVVDMQRLFIDADVSEYDLAKVEGSNGAKFRLSAYPDRVLPIYGPGDGRLVFVGAVVDPHSRTVTVRYEVPNKEGLLRLGMFADVMVETGRRDAAIVVPQEAVVDDSGEPIVYVQTGGESFERRGVQRGLRDGDNVEIRQGVSAGERVVIDGAYAIRLSTLAGGVPEHHHH